VGRRIYSQLKLLTILFVIGKDFRVEALILAFEDFRILSWEVGFQSRDHGT
jgi:hypothetical protein